MICCENIVDVIFKKIIQKKKKNKLKHANSIKIINYN